MGGFLFLLLPIIFLLTPIVLHADLYFDVVSGKIGCYLSLYGKLKLLGGYILPCAGGAALHVSDKKAILFTYKQMDEGRKKFSAKNGLHLRYAKLVMEISPEYLIGVSLLDSAAKWIFLFKNQGGKLKSKILLREDGFRIFTKVSIRTTTVEQLFYFLKYLWGRFMKKCRKIKSAT